MPAIVQGATDAELVDELFRRQPPDVTSPGRPRPILDAFKNLLAGLVGQLGPVLTPIILELLKKLLAGSGVGTSSNAVALADAHEIEIVNELAARHSATALSAEDAADTPLLDAIRAFLIQVIQQIGPSIVPFLVELLKKLLGQSTQKSRFS